MLYWQGLQERFFIQQGIRLKKIFKLDKKVPIWNWFSK